MDRVLKETKVTERFIERMKNFGERILDEAVQSLELFPNRCPLAPESEELGRKIRQLL